jgi:hypothetical protein
VELVVGDDGYRCETWMRLIDISLLILVELVVGDDGYRCETWMRLIDIYLLRIE